MHKIVIVTLSMAWAVPALADDQKSWWKFWSDETTTEMNDISNEVKNKAKASVSTTNAVFTEREKQILTDYLLDRVLPNRQHVEDSDDSYNGHKNKDNKDNKHKQLPPGLQKKLARGGELPPGWQKKVARGEVLDAELYAQSSLLPRDILDILPTNPEGTSMRLIDDRIVRVLNAGNVIIDVLTGNTAN